MIIYENTVGNFISQTLKEKNIEKYIKEGQVNHGICFGSPSEVNSWKASLPKMAEILDNKDINAELDVAIEYKLDVGKGRIDFLIYGKDESKKNNVVIVELKQWSSVKSSRLQNCVFTFGGGGRNEDYTHPSYQSFSYAEILRKFNYYVQTNNVNLTSCCYLHNLDNVYRFVVDNQESFPFVKYSKVFLQNDAEKLRNFIKQYVSVPNKELLYRIDNSDIQPTEEFSKMFKDAIKGEPYFSFDDEQNYSVSTIVTQTNKAIHEKRRVTIIVRGGPGTGKSVVALNSMGILLNPSDGSSPKNVCYCTANFTPRTMFSEILVDNNYKKVAIKALFKTEAAFANSREFDYDCILVDEAHRAFTWKFGTGIRRNINMIEKIFYASRVNVFFIDEDQVVTRYDELTIDMIKKIAKKFRSEVLLNDSLKLSSEFRCLGGENYIAFVNSFLGYNQDIFHYSPKKYDFKVFNSPSEMWNKIQEKQIKYKKSRLLAGYTHNWVSKKNPAAFDFCLEDGKFKMRWNKETDKSYILDNDQCDRIGCIHTIQGVDMDYAGIIIGKDLAFSNGKLVFNKKENATTDKASGIRNVNDNLAERLIRNTYKVLLTRAIRGTYIYCEDKGLAEYIKTFLD